MNKTLLVIGLMAMLSVGLATNGLIQMGKLEQRFTALIEGEAKASLWLARATSTLNAAGRLLNAELVERDGAMARKLSEEILEQERILVERLETAAEALPSFGADIQAAVRQARIVGAMIHEIEDLAQKGEIEAALQVKRDRFEPAFTILLTDIRSLIDRGDRDLAAASHAASESYLSARLWTLVAAAVGIAFGIGLAVLMVRRTIAAPIDELTGTMGTIAGGNLDIAVNGQDRGDEIGGMARALQVFKDNAIQRACLEGEQAAERVAKEKRAAAIERLVQTFDRAAGSVLSGVASASMQLGRTAGSMATLADQTNRQAAASAVAAEETSANVQTVAAATEEMSASIQEISRQVTRSNAIASQAAEEAHATTTSVRGLAEAAGRISDVVKLIQDIASQTNLLALNATIEAARAGEAGKGFAVVASEVKALANQTGKATEEIGAQIASVQSATQGTVKAIEGIGSTITTINEIASAIAAAIEEQNATTGEITRNVQQAAQGTAEVSENIVQVTQAAQHTGDAANQVLGASGDLSRQAEDLRREVETFLAGIRAA